MTRTQAIVDAVLVLALVIGYVVLTALHDDGNPLLLILGGAAGRSVSQNTVGAIEKNQGTPGG